MYYTYAIALKIALSSLRQRLKAKARERNVEPLQKLWEMRSLLFGSNISVHKYRINLIGMCDGVLLHVTYTERGERIRLISARKAQKYERNDYYRENAQGWDGG